MFKLHHSPGVGGQDQLVSGVEVHPQRGEVEDGARGVSETKDNFLIIPGYHSDSCGLWFRDQYEGDLEPGLEGVSLVDFQSKGVVRQPDDGQLELDPVVVVGDEGVEAGVRGVQRGGVHGEAAGAGLHGATPLTEPGLGAALELAPVHAEAGGQQRHQQADRQHPGHGPLHPQQRVSTQVITEQISKSWTWTAENKIIVIVAITNNYYTTQYASTMPWCPTHYRLSALSEALTVRAFTS